MNNTLATIHELNPIAQRMREREEVIQHNKLDVMGRIGELVGLAQEQGRDCLLAKTKLGKCFRWSEWLRAHVPNLPETVAGKYERIATEQLTDPRQCVFAFLPPAEREETEQRLPPAAWETAAGFVRRLINVAKTEPPKEWPEQQRDLVRSSLEPLAKELWPDRFNGKA